MLDVWAVLLGVIAAAAAFYLRSCMLLAMKQKAAAVRLEGYLHHWTNFVLENNLFSVFYLGIKWNEEIRELVAKGGSAADLVKLQAEKKKIIDEIQKAVRESEIDISAEEIQKQLEKIPREFAGSMLDYARQFRQNLLEGKTFLTDEEAAVLGRHVMSSALELKMNMIGLGDTAIMMMLVFTSDPEGFILKRYEKEIAQCVWRGVVISRLMDSLKVQATKIACASVLSLTLRNVRMEL